MDERILLAYEAAIATRGKNKGKLKAKCPPMGTDGAMMWQALMLQANPYKAGICHMIYAAHVDEEFMSACHKFAEERPAKYLDRDRVALESMGVW